MARLLTGLHGPFTGKLGSVIGTSWKGLHIMRVIPANHNDANTTLQQAQRAKIKLLSSFLSKCNSLIRIGFAAIDPKNTAFNNAIKHNLAEVVEGTFPNFTINIAKLKLSTGKLRNVWDPTIMSVDANTISISWTDNTNNENAFATDRLHLCVIDKETHDVHIHPTPPSRNATTCHLTLPTDWSTHDVFVIGFMAKEGVKNPKSMKDVSNSLVWEM